MFGLGIIDVVTGIIDKVITGVQENQQAKTRLMEWAMSIEGQKAVADAQDRISARERQWKLADNTTTLMAIFLFVGYFAILSAFFFLSSYFKLIPAELHDVMMLLIGSLTTAFLMVVSYYFGSSVAADKGMGSVTDHIREYTNERLRDDSNKRFRL